MSLTQANTHLQALQQLYQQNSCMAEPYSETVTLRSGRTVERSGTRYKNQDGSLCSLCDLPETVVVDSMREYLGAQGLGQEQIDALEPLVLRNFRSPLWCGKAGATLPGGGNGSSPAPAAPVAPAAPAPKKSIVKPIAIGTGLAAAGALAYLAFAR